ncbi:DNA cytosine methyltransferase [Aliarcobacter cryaerophilus]|uniref:DNA cytosine methyltransferase n=1 Tax=Aliarcobacter cryaerophilus TaxID=28198 RepID=UPI0011DFF8DD|nr:DNA cytosine methyltransferase [Aliarcobacter cryaerophilus]
MIFENINIIQSNKTEKSFFIEKIHIINELISKYCFKNRIEYNEIISDIEISIKELKLIGIIKHEEQLENLKQVLGNKEYHRLIKSLTFYSKHKSQTEYLLKNFYYSYRKEQQQINEGNNNPKIVDLFCGAGGFSLGFLKENYHVELANDIDRAAIETYKFNHPEISSDKVICKDIISIVENIDTFIKSDVDIIIGGPPCQSFSSANQQRVIDDPRNILYKYFIKATEKIKPRFVLMENVRGMKKVAAQVVDDFKKIGYDVVYKLYNSYDFSVPQSRTRLIYIGVERNFSVKQNITSEDIIEELDKEINNKPKYVLKDALSYIKELECAKIKNITEKDCEISGKKIDINIFRGLENEYLKLINDKQVSNFTFNHKARYQNENNQKIYATLKQGRDSTCESIKDIMPYSHRNHIFKDKYFKLVDNLPSRTITAHMKMDCHSHIHPSQIRSITPREAARIQSFPDNYLFLGSYLNTYRQIGNAVPPLMGRTFAKVLKKYL